MGLIIYYINFLVYIKIIYYYVIIKSKNDNIKRDLPDSNWDPSKWQLETLPIKLRSLKFNRL